MRRALVIAPNWIGDALMAQPLFARLVKLHPRIVIDAVAPSWVAPVLERIADEHKVKLVKVNIDENQDLAMRYGIQSIPNMVLFEGGAPKASAVGAMPKGMLERQLGFES